MVELLPGRLAVKITEDRGQKSEDRSQKTEDRGRAMDDG